jgi:hypothetical protein
MDEPTLIFDQLNLDSLRLPAGLYDPKTPGLPAAWFNAAIPIMVARDTQGRYTIIDGCKRLACARELGRQTVLCGIMELPQDPGQIGLWRIRSNRGRRLHVREKRLFLCWLRSWPDQALAAALLDDLAISSREQHELEPLIGCDELVMDAVAEGWLHPANVRDFSLLSAADGSAFLQAFRNLKLSLQTQRELIEWLGELAAGQGTDVAGVLAEPALKQLLTDENLTAPQRIEKIRNLLYRRRFPRYSAAEAQWLELARRCNPKPGAVSFTHDPFFEKNRLTVQVTVRTAAEALTLFGQLSSLPVEGWQKLIYPCEEGS